jgi:glycosyltransferase involved in cell wall biosynthesis
MRILFLGEATSPYTRVWAEHSAVAFGHEVHLASLQEPSSAPVGVTFHPLGRRFGRLGYLAAIPAARALARRLRPDLTVAYRVTSYGVLAAAAGLHPLAMAAQGMHIAFPPTSRMKRALARYALARADLVTSWGAHMTRNMIALGCDPARIRTIAYGIDTERFTMDGSRPRPGTPTRLLSTRALRADYNLEPILRALPDVLKRFPDAVWTAVGEGPEKERLVALADTLGVAKHVEFPGRVSIERLVELLRACDVYVSTVRTDGVSASLLEAMACGAWPVVTDNEANRLWIRPDLTGDLVPAGDPHAIGRAIGGALADPARAARAREENRRLVCARASMRENMAVIDGMFGALVQGGIAAVPPVPAHLVVPPPDGAPGAGTAEGAP